MKRIECEQFSRCVGYYRPLSQANRGKQEEIKNRTMLNWRQAYASSQEKLPEAKQK